MLCEALPALKKRKKKVKYNEKWKIILSRVYTVTGFSPASEQPSTVFARELVAAALLSQPRVSSRAAGALSGRAVTRCLSAAVRVGHAQQDHRAQRGAERLQLLRSAGS